MENTLIVHDRVVVNKLSGSPDRGEVVVFKGWDGTDWIKRVIAVGGDTVECCDSRHHLSVNGTPIDETYLYPGNYASGDDFKVTVPKGRLWVMGDHRVASRDSRARIQDRFHGTIGGRRGGPRLRDLLAVLPGEGPLRAGGVHASALAA